MGGGKVCGAGEPTPSITGDPGKAVAKGLLRVRVFCTIMGPGERTLNGAMGRTPGRSALEN